MAILFTQRWESGAGNPKVFFKYFYVNTATGEKSGDMLALTKFEADEEDGD